MRLLDAKTGESYLIKEIMTEDEELNGFLLSLGCYSGEPIMVISHGRSGSVVAIKNARYNLDRELACAIQV